MHYDYFESGEYIIGAICVSVGETFIILIITQTLEWLGIYQMGADLSIGGHYTSGAQRYSDPTENVTRAHFKIISVVGIKAWPMGDSIFSWGYGVACALYCYATAR